MRRRLLSLPPVAALRSTRLPLVGYERASTTFGRPCGRGCQSPKLRLLLGGCLTGDWSSSVATKANRSCDSASVSFRHSGHVPLPSWRMVAKEKERRIHHHDLIQSASSAQPNSSSLPYKSLIQKPPQHHPSGKGSCLYGAQKANPYKRYNIHSHSHPHYRCAAAAAGSLSIVQIQCAGRIEEAMGFSRVSPLFIQHTFLLPSALLLRLQHSKKRVRKSLSSPILFRIQQQHTTALLPQQYLLIKSIDYLGK